MDPADARQIFDRAAGTYDKVAFPFFAPFGEALVEFAGIRGDDRVLDAGCGAGAALAPAAARTGSATGIEISPAMAERARAAAPSAKVVVGDATSLPFDDGSFDVVISSFVVFFFSDPTAALREWARVLRPGGRIAIATWGAPDPRWAFEREVRKPYAAQLDPEFLKGAASAMALLDRFNTPEKAAEELRAAGCEPDDAIEHSIEFAFRDAQAWWEWNWSHGTRVFLEALPAEAHERLFADMSKAMDVVRDRNGYPRTFTSVLTRGSIRATDSPL